MGYSVVYEPFIALKNMGFWEEYRVAYQAIILRRENDGSTLSQHYVSASWK